MVDAQITDDAPAPGRRERKKAVTHRAIADAALGLFLAYGFDAVSVRDVAEAADVSTTTLFKHFPSKEALVFDEADDREAGLLAAVHDRDPGVSIPGALLDHLLLDVERETQPGIADFLRLIHTTPALAEYGRRLWTRHENALARLIASEAGAAPDDLASAVLARFALEAPALVRARADPAAALRAIFVGLEAGWDVRPA